MHAGALLAAAWALHQAVPCIGRKGCTAQSKTWEAGAFQVPQGAALAFQCGQGDAKAEREYTCLCQQPATAGLLWESGDVASLMLLETAGSAWPFQKIEIP